MKIPKEWTTLEKVGVYKYKIIETTMELGKNHRATDDINSITTYCKELKRVLEGK